MEIKYLGWSAFKIIKEGLSLIIDPFDPIMVGLKWTKQNADIVCISHHHGDHSYQKGVEGVKLTIDSPGEYEVQGVRIYGVFSLHDDEGGKKRGVNTMYRVDIDNFTIVHTGDLGQKLTQEQVEKLGTVDVLILPVGSEYTINYETAAEVVAQIEPAIVMPCHYQVEGLKIEGIDKVDKFLDEMGETNREKCKSLVLSSRSQLPEETEVKVLENSQS